MGAILALSAWLIQSYLSGLDASRIELRDAIRTAESQREMWMIEYNGSLIRQPRSEHVTARAALEVIECTREYLSYSEIAASGPFSLQSVTLDSAGEDIARARTLLDERNYRELVTELDAVNDAFDELRAAQTTGSGPKLAGFVWWRHAIPVVFLIGIGLCLTGSRRHAARDE